MEQNKNEYISDFFGHTYVMAFSVLANNRDIKIKELTKQQKKQIIEDCIKICSESNSKRIRNGFLDVIKELVNSMDK